MIVAAGCPGDEKPVEKAPDGALPRASVTLRVAVVSDEALRGVIDRLRGEWQELTDGTIETVDVAEDADLVAAAGEADLIVFPSRAIGVLCEADALRPVRSSVIESEALRFEDFLPLVRDHEIVYAQQAMALPLGCPTPLHLLPDAGLAGSRITNEGIELALVYLAHAAPHAVHPSRVATLFDSDTFEPRLIEPPFVRALEDLASTHDSGGEGRIVWPRRDEPARAGFTPQVMPSAAEVFDPIAAQWEPVPAEPASERHATLLASSGRLIAITKSSRNAATAFRYAGWLAGPENARQISYASNNVGNCRGSLARAGDAWRVSDGRELAKEFAGTAAAALRMPRFLFAPRLPGSEEYLEALAKHVRAALDGKPAAEALAEAAADWERISESRGRDKQRAAYERSINNASFPDRR